MDFGSMGLGIILFGFLPGMALLSCVIAILRRFSEQKLTRVYNGLYVSVGFFSIGIGITIMLNYLQI